MSKLYNGMIDEDVIGVIANYIGVMNYDKDYIGTFIYGYMEDNERCIHRLLVIIITSMKIIDKKSW